MRTRAELVELIDLARRSQELEPISPPLTCAECCVYTVVAFHRQRRRDAGTMP